MSQESLTEALQGEKAPYWPGALPFALIPEQSTPRSPQMYPKRLLMLAAERLGLAWQPNEAGAQLQRPWLGVGGREVAAIQTEVAVVGQLGGVLLGV